MDTQVLVIVVGVGILIGLAKGGLGGVAMLAVPLLSLVMDTKTAVASALPLLLVGDAIATYAYWGEWDKRMMWLMLPAGIGGTLVGVYLLTITPDVALRRFIGIITLLYVAYRLAGVWLQALEYDPPDWVGMIAGFTAGITSSMAQAGAPPFQAYLLLKHLEPTVFVATFTLYFAVINVVKVPLYIQIGTLRWEPFLQVIGAVVMIPFGVWLGRYFVKHVSVRVFTAVILVMLFVTGVALLI